MSDKHEYWKEIFGDDLPEGLAEELGVSDLEDNPESEGTFPVDESLFQPREDEAPAGELEQSDTHVLPPEVKDFSEITGGGHVAAREEGEPEEALEEAPEPFDGDFDLGEDEVEEEVEDDEEDEDDEDDRAVRFARRRRTGCLGGLMYAVFIIGASVILACVGWMAANDFLALSKEDFTVEITVPENYDIAEITEDLYAEGIIDYKFLFRWFADIYNAEEKIQPGVYQVSTVDYRAIIVGMNQSGGEMVEQDALIPEGKTLEEVFQILEDREICSVENLEEAAATYDFDYSFLVGLPMGDASRLEGYLFPDTYTFYKQQSAESVLDKMLENFDQRMEANGIYEMLEESELTLHEAVTIASMLEGEAASAEEMPTVSSVIHNRLAIGQPLQIDATVQYALPERKEYLTEADTHVDSPYNTYEVEGLPYGPISNPGVASIKAAIEPESTGYYYYALHVDGYHEFFTNQADHEYFQTTEEFAGNAG